MLRPARSAEQLQEQVQHALAENPIGALRSLRVEQLDDGSLLIQGRVDSYYHKQLAQETVRCYAPLTHVVNSVQVN